jgi:4-azaleucine resistance transporter AzlC
MPSSRSEFIAGVKAELPILLGVIPFGLIYGVLASGAGLPASLAQAMSSIVFAGSAQFIAAQLISVGTPALVLVLTTLVVNLRHMLYSASVAPYIKHLRPQWKWLLAYLLTDEAYAVTILHYQKADDQETGGAPPAHKHWFFLGAGLALWSTWQVSTGVGIFVGAQVPPSWSLDFTLALTFIALVVPALKDRAGWVAALVGGTVAVLAAGLPFKLGLIIAALSGILAGLGVERYAASVSSPASAAAPGRRGIP